jgi:hypothetical protein
VKIKKLFPFQLRVAFHPERLATSAIHVKKDAVGIGAADDIGCGLKDRGQARPGGFGPFSLRVFTLESGEFVRATRVARSPKRYLLVGWWPRVPCSRFGDNLFSKLRATFEPRRGEFF